MKNQNWNLCAKQLEALTANNTLMYFHKKISYMFLIFYCTPNCVHINTQKLYNLLCPIFKQMSATTVRTCGSA
jgi:hypothetical protein